MVNSLIDTSVAITVICCICVLERKENQREKEGEKVSESNEEERWKL